MMMMMMNSGYFCFSAFSVLLCLLIYREFSLPLASSISIKCLINIKSDFYVYTKFISWGKLLFTFPLISYYIATELHKSFLLINYARQKGVKKGLKGSEMGVTALNVETNHFSFGNLYVSDKLITLSKITSVSMALLNRIFTSN